jgi:hypothetical protein
LASAAAPAAFAQPYRGWLEVPAYVPLFAPATHAGAYRAFVSPLPLTELLRTLADDQTLLRPPGAWEGRRGGALDAFGRSGGYDRWTLAQLYGGRGATVARGPRAVGGRVVESWALISPYPDPQLRRLEPGTLILVLMVP